MTRALDYARFVAVLAGPVSRLLRMLFERHGGDPKPAERELQLRIEDWGADLDAHEAKLEEQMRAALAARDPKAQA